jgi:hydroxymethylpyrimidine pyrophosphatase-like HAD family hydrolase
MKKKEVEARRRFTEHCLIAADIDKTLLTQTEEERKQFLDRVAPQLVDSAKMGMKLAFVTGNSMSQLADRFLTWLVEHLCNNDNLALLSQFHFFCNSGGVYFHFPTDHKSIQDVMKGHPTGQKELAGPMFDVLTSRGDDGKTLVDPQFVDANYLARTQIPAAEIEKITKILEQCGRHYLKKIEKAKTKKDLASYNLSKVMMKRQLIPPSADRRCVAYASRSRPRYATVQVTLKPILSFRHGKTKKQSACLFGKDQRTEVIEKVQAKLDKQGLGHYIARPGGWSSIDVTLEKLDKAYAMRFLIDSLNLQGHARQGQLFGVNAIYFGDEVIVGGGNDYAVTRIPGLPVFAVNSDRALVPWLSDVFVPSTILEGPEATAEALGDLNKIARTLLQSARSPRKNKKPPHGYSERGTAIDSFKIELFSKRIHEKIEALRNSERLTSDEWQVLHAFVTLMHRDDATGRRWLAILVDELDAIMTLLSESSISAPKRPLTPPAIGDS